MKRLFVLVVIAFLGAHAAPAACTNTWGVKLVKINADGGATDSAIGSATEGHTIIGFNATGRNGNYNVERITYTEFAKLNFDGGDTFSGDSPFPLGGSVNDQFAVRAEVIALIPAGIHTMGFGSDDGGYIRLTQIQPAGTFNFFNEFNNSGSVAGDNEIRWETGRGHAWTTGSITVAQPTEVKITVMSFEGSGGESLEVAIRNGQASGGVNTTDWALLEDGAKGWALCQEGYNIKRPFTLGNKETPKPEDGGVLAAIQK